eukprot:scaffold74724_cov16-Tisochrysis_lutea.AAC.3
MGLMGLKVQHHSEVITVLNYEACTESQWMDAAASLCLTPVQRRRAAGYKFQASVQISWKIARQHCTRCNELHVFPLPDFK